MDYKEVRFGVFLFSLFIYFFLFFQRQKNYYDGMSTDLNINVENILNWFSTQLNNEYGHVSDIDYLLFL